MKPLTTTIASALLAAAFFIPAGAQAHHSQSSYYYSTGPADSDADLQAASRVCDQRFGTIQNGSDTPEPYRQCMLAQGWEYGYTMRNGTYPGSGDDEGLTCHDFVFLGIVGSSCSNY